MPKYLAYLNICNYSCTRKSLWWLWILSWSMGSLRFKKSENQCRLFNHSLRKSNQLPQLYNHSSQWTRNCHLCSKRPSRYTRYHPPFSSIKRFPLQQHPTNILGLQGQLPTSSAFPNPSGSNLNRNWQVSQINLQIRLWFLWKIIHSSQKSFLISGASRIRSGTEEMYRLFLIETGVGTWL